MSLEALSLAIGGVSCGVGLLTFALVIRNELRASRLGAPIVWHFRRYGTWHRDSGEAPLEIAELVQYGRQPTSVLMYALVGFSLRQEPDYRLRTHIRSEDTLPLLLEKVDPDGAWLLIGHLPRDDRRWCHFEWVPLFPLAERLQDRAGAQWDALDREARTVLGRARRVTTILRHGRSVVRPVGPAGHRWARIRVDRGGRPAHPEEVAEILSLAAADDPNWTIIMGT